MNGNCSKQLNFMKQYFLKNQIAQQLISDDLSDIQPENFDDASTNAKHHQRFNSDQQTKPSLTKIPNCQNYCQSSDISNITTSSKSNKSILKTPKSLSQRKHQKIKKKVHFRGKLE